MNNITEKEGITDARELGIPITKKGCPIGHPFFVDLIETEKHLQTTVNAREAHEGETQQASGEHDNGHTLHALGNLHQLELLAHTSKHSERQSEANGCGEGVDYRLQEVVVLLDAEDGHTKHGAVGGDEGEEDAKRLIESRRHFLKHDFDQLYQRGNDQNESDGLQILEAEGVEHVFLYQPGNDGGKCQHKRDSCRHAQRGINLLGYTEEWTDAEEL